jgi:DNA-binding protein H-NS
MATTYEQIKAQIAELERQASDARRQEIKDAVSTVRELIQKHRLSVRDIGERLFGKPGAGRGAKSAGPKSPPKFRDPLTGKTWTGRGKPPNWIVGVANRDPFLIDKAAATPKKAKAAPTRKAAPKSPAH